MRLLLGAWEKTPFWLRLLGFEDHRRIVWRCYLALDMQVNIGWIYSAVAFSLPGIQEVTE